MKKLILVLFIAMSGQVYGQFADYLLSNSEKLNMLPTDKYEMINSELTKITEKFINEVFGDSFWTTTIFVITGREIDEGCSLNCIMNLVNPGVAEEAYCESICSYSVGYNSTINRKFDINETLSTSEPEWSEIVEFYGGYSNLPSGFTKEDKSKFLITTELKYIELTGPNSCVAKIITSGDENYGLKFYNLEKSEQEVTGTYSLPKFSYIDIYNIEESITYEKRLKDSENKLQLAYESARTPASYLQDKDNEIQQIKRKLSTMKSGSISFEFPENSFFEKRERSTYLDQERKEEYILLPITGARRRVTINDLLNDDVIKSASGKRELITLMLNDLVSMDDIQSFPEVIKMNESFNQLLTTSSANDIIEALYLEVYKKVPPLLENVEMDFISMDCDEVDKILKNKIQQDLRKLATMKIKFGKISRRDKKELKEYLSSKVQKELATFSQNLRLDGDIFFRINIYEESHLLPFSPMIKNINEWKEIGHITNPIPNLNYLAGGRQYDLGVFISRERMNDENGDIIREWYWNKNYFCRLSTK